MEINTLQVKITVGCIKKQNKTNKQTNKQTINNQYTSASTCYIYPILARYVVINIFFI